MRHGLGGVLQRRLREGHKTIALTHKNKSSARPARAFFILVHFIAVLVLTTTWIHQISGCVEDVRAWRNFLNFLPKQPHNSCQFYSCNVDTHFPFRTTSGYDEVTTITLASSSCFRKLLIYSWVALSTDPRDQLQHSLCNYSRFSHDITTAMLVPLNKEKAAMLVPRPNPPGI